MDADASPPSAALKPSAVAFEEAVDQAAQTPYLLRLYVTGPTPNSLRAIANLKAICKAHLDGRCELEIIDLHRHPERAIEANLVAAPTLVKQLPPPVRRIVGDLTDVEQVLLGLSLLPLAASRTL